jgi:cytochrome c biogenesis protein CcmG, thiol:disulfide interchange protein DsbE
LDLAAVAVIAFAVWKIFLAPRAFLPAGAQPAPHATYQLLDGGSLRTADLHGHLIFLDFYASWCVPCRAELPLVEAWSKGHPDAVVVPIDVGESRSVAAVFAHKYALAHVALDPTARARALFGLQGFPTIVVIDPAGDVRAKWEGLNPAIAIAMTNAQTALGH